MTQITLEVTGMTCAHCATAVTRALQRVPGVESAQVDLAAHRATVEGSAEPARLVEAVREQGYGAGLPA